MNTLILTGGNWPNDARVLALVRNCDNVFCCDGAAKDARRLGIIPHLLIGDMDSIAQEDRDFMQDKGVHEVILPAQKDESDTEAACRLAIDRGAERVILAGGFGGRMDHSLGNIQCLWMLHNEGVEARMESGDELALIVTASCLMGQYTGHTFSLIPLLPQTAVFRMTGVKYPLIHAPLPLGCTLGISNVVTSPDAQLTIQSGTALLIINLVEG